MATQNKFEEMLERLINEDREGAEELFHEIVVEKSRDIYESLLEADEEVEESDEDLDEANDEEVDESDEDLDEADDEEVDESDEDLDESADEDLDEFMDEPVAMEGDPTDELEKELGNMGDEEGEPEGEPEGDAEGAEAALDDLEAALDALKDEFAAMTGGNDEGDADMDMDMDSEEEPEEESFAFEAEKDEDDEEEVEEAADDDEKSVAEQMREYVEKINGGGLDNNGLLGSEASGTNAKSIVAGKNDMGGTSANIAQGKDNESGAHDGLGDMNAKEDNAGNRNVPGGMSSKKGMKTEPGHGAEKKGKAPEASGSDSPLNGAPKRAK